MNLIQQVIDPTGDGLHLRESILWFDSVAQGDLSFVSRVPENAAGYSSKVLATEVTLRLIENQSKKPKGLICQFNRPFSIGRLKMELLPSGYGLGAASLFVETGNHTKLLYAPRLLLEKNSSVREIQLKKADILILGAESPEPQATNPNRKKEKERLIEAIRDLVARGIYPIVLCKNYPLAQEITKLITDQKIPLAVHDSIFKVNRIYENHNSDLGNYNLFRPKKTRNKVVLYPSVTKRRLRSFPPEGPVLSIEETAEEQTTPDPFQKIEGRFFISSICDSKDLKEVIARVDAKTVCFFGPYAKRHTDYFKSENRSTFGLYPNHQPTLL